MTTRGAAWVSADRLGVEEDPSPPPVDLSAYLAMQPAWKSEAACREADLDDFFADESDTVRVGRALSLCRDCPVIEECLAQAMGTPGPTYGVYGGTTARQRRAMRREAKAKGEAA